MISFNHLNNAERRIFSLIFAKEDTSGESFEVRLSVSRTFCPTFHGLQVSLTKCVLISPKHRGSSLS